MDEYATPIEQIRPDIQNNQQQQQNIPVNYSDMLQSMETHQQQPQQMQQQDYPPHPIVQSKIPHNANMNMNYVQPQQHHHQDEEKNYSQIQKDIMYILVPSILLYSHPVQNQLLKVLPSLFKEDKPTILGNVVNGVIIAMIFVGMKNMKINFS